MVIALEEEVAQPTFEVAEVVRNVLLATAAGGRDAGAEAGEEGEGGLTGLAELRLLRVKPAYRFFPVNMDCLLSTYHNMAQ